jgi:hypothetical protein
MDVITEITPKVPVSLHLFRVAIYLCWGGLMYFMHYLAGAAVLSRKNKLNFDQSHR